MNNKNILFELKEIDCLIIREVMGNTKDKNKLPLSPVQAKIIRYLLVNKEKKTFQKDLEKILGLRRSTISGVLQTMEKNMLIKRLDVESDARIKQIILTDKAIQCEKEIKEKFSMIESKISNNISHEDMDIFIKVCRQMKNNLIEGND